MKGSTYKLRVSISTKKHLPDKKNSRRVELDALVKESGRWEDVSDLNTASLLKLMDSGELSGEKVGRLSEYASTRESSLIRVSELKEGEK